MTNNFQIFFLITIIIVCLSCSESQRVEKNSIEITLDKIEEGAAIEQVIQIFGDSIVVKWDEPEKYESSCEQYKIIPNIDTFKYEYYLDICYDRYNWWDRKNK